MSFQTSALQYVVSERVTSGVGLPATDTNDEDPRYIRTTDIEDRRTLKSGCRYSQPRSLLASAGVKKFDLLVTNAGMSIGKSYLHTSDESGVYAGYLTRVRFDPWLMDARFAAFWAESQHFWDQVNTKATRSTIDNVSSGKYQAFRVPVPSLDAQRRVSDMLDVETARMDRLVSAVEESIRLVEQRWESQVETDTMGGEASVPFRFLASELDNRAGSTGLTLPLLSVSISQGVRLRSSGGSNQAASLDLAKYKIVRRGQIVLNRMRAFQGAVGEAPVDGLVSPDYAVLKHNDRTEARYLHYAMRSPWFIAEMTKRLRGIGTPEQGAARTPRINIGDLGRIEVPLPPIERQRDIAKRLAERRETIDRFTRTARMQIDLAGTRRQSLITAAVTGQITV